MFMIRSNGKAVDVEEGRCITGTDSSVCAYLPPTCSSSESLRVICEDLNLCMARLLSEAGEGERMKCITRSIPYVLTLCLVLFVQYITQPV